MLCLCWDGEKTGLGQFPNVYLPFKQRFPLIRTGTMATGTKLIDDEAMEHGSVSYSVYLFYCRAATWIVAVGYVASYVANSGFTVGTNFWLATWSEAEIANDNVSVV